MTTIREVLFVAFVSLAVVAVAWPSLLVLSRQTDDPDNWLVLFYSGVFVLMWVFVL